MSKIEDLKKLQELYPKGCVAQIFFDEESVSIISTESAEIKKGDSNEQPR